MLFHFVYQWASFAALLCATAVGFWRGGWPERVAAASMVLAWAGTALVYNSIQLKGVQAAVMLVDLALMLVLLFLALRSDRWWPMWACGFQSLSMVLHLAMLADPKIWGRAYFIANNTFSYLTMITLIIGALSRPRARKSATPSASQ